MTQNKNATAFSSVSTTGRQILLEDDPIEFLQSLLHPVLQQTETLLAHRCYSPISLIPQIGQHLLGAGGKRLRPMLTASVAHWFGCDHTDAVASLSASIEFLHTATLLHDDVIDNSDIRRGKSTARTLWGNSASILVGDYLFSQAFQLMMVPESIHILRVLAKAAATISEGEVFQLTFHGRLDVSLDDYLAMIGAKTACLFGAATEVGAMVASQPADIQQSVQQFGYALGMAFQIMDDILDYIGDPTQFGKASGGDFFEHKMTLPVLLAYAKADPKQKNFWSNWIQGKHQGSESLSQAMEWMHHHNSFDEAQNYAKQYTHTAQKILQDLPSHLVRDQLEKLVYNLTYRMK